MNPSDLCLELIELSEGFRSMPYSDAAGVGTVGYGHKILSGEDFSAGLTEAQAKTLLASDAQRAAQAVDGLVTVPLNQNQFDALVDFAFNLGANALRESTLLRLLNAGNYAAIPNEMQRWIYASDKVLPGLVTRRKREASLWCGNQNFKEIV